MAASYQRYIWVRVRGLEARIPTTFCLWCMDSGVCSVCAAKAAKARASLTKTADKRDARHGRIQTVLTFDFEGV